MRAQLDSDAGVKTLEQMIAANNASMPGNNEMDAVAVWTAWLQGKVAMIFSWPPSGRLSAGYSQSDKAINFVPQSTIADKVGYALMPGKNGEHASGYVKALTADSGDTACHAVGGDRWRSGAVAGETSIERTSARLSGSPPTGESAVLPSGAHAGRPRYTAAFRNQAPRSA